MSKVKKQRRMQLSMLLRHAVEMGQQNPYLACRKDAKVIWESLNRAIFYGQLSFPKSISVRNYKTVDWWGECEGRHNGSRCGPNYTRIIRLQSHWPNKKKFITVLAHEMVHQWEWEKLGTMSHGKDFFSWQEKLNDKGIALSIKM